jgi:hypothetical protein
VASTSDELAAGLSWNWIPGFSAIFDVELNRITNIGEGFGATITLAYASWQRRETHDVATV